MRLRLHEVVLRNLICKPGTQKQDNAALVVVSATLWLALRPHVLA